MPVKFHAGPLIFAGLLGLVLAIIGLFWVRVLDPDVLLHLRTGRLIVQNRSIPTRDVFSSSALGEPWVTHEWLWQVGTFLIYKAMDWWGLFAFRAGLVIAALGMMLATGSRRGAQVWAGVVALLIVIGPIASFAEIRPQLFSLMLFAATLLLLDCGRSRPRLMLLLVPLFTLWSNVHAAVLLGYSLIGAVMLGHFVNLWQKPATTANPAYLKWLLITGGLCLVAAMVNPHGYHILTFPLKVVGHDVFRTQIFEWAPPDFSRPFLPFWALVVLSVVLALVSFRILRSSDWILLAVFFLAALSSRRQIPFYAMVTLLWLPGAVQRLTRDKVARQWAAVLVAMLLPVLSIWAYFAAGRVVGTGLARDRFPEDTAIRLAHLPMDGAVLNDYNDGGYLIWRLWPEWLVTMDGRADVYGPKRIRQYEQVWTGAPGWQEIVRQWNVQAVLGRYEISRVRPDHNLYHEIARTEDWALLHWDASHVLYVRKGRVLESYDRKPYRRLHPGLRWHEIAALQKTTDEWNSLGADLRRSLSEYPENGRAVDLERCWRNNEARPAGTYP